MHDWVDGNTNMHATPDAATPVNITSIEINIGEVSELLLKHSLAREHSLPFLQEIAGL